MEEKGLAAELAVRANKTKEPVKPLIDRVKEMITPSPTKPLDTKTASIGIRG